MKCYISGSRITHFTNITARKNQRHSQTKYLRLQSLFQIPAPPSCLPLLVQVWLPEAGQCRSCIGHTPPVVEFLAHSILGLEAQDQLGLSKRNCICFSFLDIQYYFKQFLLHTNFSLFLMILVLRQTATNRILLYLCILE